MEVTLVLSNLPSGYHRDMQILKEVLMPAFDEILDCLNIADFMLEHIQVKPNLLDDPKYDLLFSVERVNELVLQGVPFREAYRTVGKEIAEHTYSPPRELHHTHEGSIGNLGNDLIAQQMQQAIEGFGAERAKQAIQQLLK
jgi:argininosuccinate lyase